MKLVVQPLSFVGDLVRLIVESPETVHFVSQPLTLITSSVLIVECSLSVSGSIEFEAFIAAALAELLFNLHQLISYIQ